MGTHPIFESDFDCLTDYYMHFSGSTDRVTNMIKLLLITFTIINADYVDFRRCYKECFDARNLEDSKTCMAQKCRGLQTRAAYPILPRSFNDVRGDTRSPSYYTRGFDGDWNNLML